MSASNSTTSSTASSTAPSIIELTDDASWCWFQHPRAIHAHPYLIIGSVASGHIDAQRRGQIELVVRHLERGTTQVIALYPSFEVDDHDSPSLYQRTDGRFVALFSKHGTESSMYYTLSLQPHDPTAWEPVKPYIPSAVTQLTYANLFYLSAERRLYDFFRGLHGSYKPSYLYSEDEGSSWQVGNIVIEVPSQFKHRPYVRYASNHVDTIHLIYSEAHPRDYDNSIYHIYYQNGNLHRSDGSVIRSLKEGLHSPDEGTLIYRGSSERVAWPTDVVLHGDTLTVVYSVQYDSQQLPVGQGGDDIRYRLARLDLSSKSTRAWQDYDFAFAGCRLYSGEDDYSGLVAIEPQDPDVFYLSANADPVTGKPLISEADNKRHYELFRADFRIETSTFSFTALTSNSTLDNLRPIRAELDRANIDANQPRRLLFLRGHYYAWTDFKQSLMLMTL